MPDSTAKMDGEKQAPGRSRDSISNILIVAVSLSLVWSILVSTTAVLLKPRQIRNEELNRQEIILDVAGLLAADADIETLFQQIEARVVNLESGGYVDDIDPAEFDALAAANDPKLGVSIPSDQDIANIKKRARHALVYHVKRDGELEQVILPVHGYGLWSTMYGFVALARDGNTIRGLQFYEHAETPGLGDQIDNPRWRALWKGKMIYGPDGEPRIQVIKGAVDPDRAGDDAVYQVDGLAGATLTARGVTNLMRYWMGADGFSSYLENLRRTGE